MRVFETPGPVNTNEVIEILKTASARYHHIVVASITGDSAVRIAETISGKNLICVTCPQGMSWQVDGMQTGPFAVVPELRQIRDRWENQGLQTVPMQISEENRIELDRMGVKIVQGTIPLFGPSFSIRLHLKQVTSLDIMAKTLELISTGTLVSLECVMMAVDAGLVPEGAHVLAAAGTERGLDTAWVIRGSASANLFHPTEGCRFVELLAKPGLPVLPDVDIEYLR
jgi:uncharacterized protein